MTLAYHTVPRRAALALAATAFVLSACAGLPADVSPPSPSVAAITPSDLVRSSGAFVDENVPARWWELFGDPILAALVAQARHANLDLEVAGMRVEEARARLGLADAALRPSLAGAASFTRSGLSENSPLVKLGASPTPIDTWNLGLQAGWEIDLWGRLKSLSTAANARLQAAAYEREAAYVSISAEAARTYLVLRGVQAQERIWTSNRAISGELVRMAESRQRNGVATRFDGAAARADLATIDAKLRQLQHQRDVLLNALAFLLARSPHELDVQLSYPGSLPSPARLPVGVLSDVARRRPDILQAEAQLRAALSDTQAARADFYPRIQLTGNLGVAGFEASNLSHWGSREFSVGPKIYLPIFDGGRLKSNLELSQVHHRLAATHYRRSVLRAWHEVDDAMGALESERERLDLLASAVEQNRVALQVSRRGYQQGSADFTTVLLANRALLASEAELANGQTSSALAIVVLYRALGGGWSEEFAQAQPGSGANP